ncbi:GBF-interacting protein 1 [Linum perenne]
MGSETGTRTINGGSGVGGGATTLHRVPADHKKIVQSVREVVNNGNYTDSEIYAVLQDCDMDPNDAVQKLLSQDTFHEVKSKRERRKEMKDTQELKGRGSSSHFVAKVSAERSFGDVQSQGIYNAEPGKAAYRRANGSAGPVLPSSSLTNQVKNPSDWASSHSDSFEGNSTSKNIGSADSSSQISQSSWVGGSFGHVSMADVVRMGGPHKKGIQTSVGTSSHSLLDVDSDGWDHNSFKTSPSQPEIDHNVQYPLLPNGSESTLESGLLPNEFGFEDEQPELRSGHSSAFNSSIAPRLDRFSTQSYVHGSNGYELRVNGPCDGATLLEADDASKNQCSDSVNSGSLSATRGNGSHLASQQNSSSEISPPAEILQKLSLGEKPAEVTSDNKHGVVFPNYIQALAADCSHLSFGTYKPGAQSPISGVAMSDSIKSNLFAAERSPSLNMGLPGDSSRPEQLGSIGNTPLSAVGTTNHGMPVQVPPELIRGNVPAATQQRDYFSQFSLPDSTFKQFQDHNTSSTMMHPNAITAPSLPQELQVNSTTIPTDFLASNFESLRNHDDLLSTFGSTQQIPLSRYGNITSTGSSNILIPEVLNSSAHALPMSYSQGFPGSSLPREHALSQHAPSSQPFSQPSLTLEELAKLSEYAALSQNYALRSSSLQSAYEESSAYHDSLARMKNLSQLNGDASRSNFLRSDADVSGYGAFGRQSNYRESFPHDLSSNLSGSAVGYGDTFRSSVNGGNNLSSLSQNDISSPWEYGLGTRTLSGIQDNQYRGLQGYNQLRPSYKQEEQLSRNYSALGYGSLYASQGSLAAQEQWRDVSNTSGYQVPSSKQQQTWGQNY